MCDGVFGWCVCVSCVLFCFVGVVIDKCHLCSFLFVLYVVLSASVWCVVCDVWLRVVGSLLCGVLCVH